MLEQIKINPSAVSMLSAEVANEHRIVCYEKVDNTLLVYSDQERIFLSQEVSILTGFEIKAVPLDGNQIDQLLNTYYGYHSDYVLKKVDKTDPNFLKDLIMETLAVGGSDIHFEAYENKARIRIRLDGHLVERYDIDPSQYTEIVNQLKIESRLDIAEKRIPQDGRINYQKNGVDVDIRINSLPTLHGEKIVLRLLGKTSANLDLEHLGFSDSELTLYKDLLRKPNGIFLISGPTGSGKTTTLYATLRELNNKDVNILTIEDPIEYTLEGINQVQLNEKVGLGFSSAMRSFLRQDPDIIMVGEIRDADTALMATRAALTGHLVFSTIHTNSAFGIINRLLELDIKPFILAETLTAGIAQRLVRKLCEHCKVRQEAAMPIGLGLIDQTSTYQAMGCPKCLGTGYAGRIAIYEILPGSDDLKEIMKMKKHEVEKYMLSKGLPTLKQSAIRLLEQGNTSYVEIIPFLI